MGERSVMRAWLWRERRTLGWTASLCVLFAGVCFLYGLPGEAALYCILLGVCVLGLAELAGYFRYRARLREIELLLEHPPENPPPFPPPWDRLEHDYQALAQRLCRERVQQTVQAQQARREMMDYYTLWAHQIKTPLSAMRLLLRSPAGAAGPEMEGELIQVERYVNMVLSYLRLDSESSDFVFARQPLEPIVRGAVRKLARLFTLKGITLDLPPMELTVLTDSKWLAFVLEQLLTNAVKYTPQRGHVSLRLEGRTLILQDSGIGIRAQDLPRIFEKGFTGYNGREEQRSTGLGLYLCRRVLDKLGHAIRIASAPGQGTRVELTFSDEDPVYE